MEPPTAGTLNGRRMSDVVSSFIRDVGFPVAVAAYLLLSLSPKMDTLVQEIKALRVEMTVQLRSK